MIIRGYEGRKVFSADGTLIFGKSRGSDLLQIGPAPINDLTAYRASNGSIVVAGANVTPFSVSGGSTGDNQIIEVTREGVRWLNIPSNSAPVSKSISFLRGFAGANLANTVTRLNSVIGFGQSTSNGTEGIPPLTTSCPNSAIGFLWMNDVAMFGQIRGTRILGHEHAAFRNCEPVDTNTLRRLIPTRETQESNNGETQMSQLGYELQKRLGNTEAVHVGTTGIGSQGFATLGPGTVPANNVLSMIWENWLTAKMYNLDYRVAVFYPENEGNVLEDANTFYTHPQTLHTWLANNVTTMTDGDVTEVYIVMNGFTNSGPYNRIYTEQCLGQLQFAIDNPSFAVYATPDYLFPRYSGDNAHYTAASAALNGAYAGRALASLWNGHDPLPLYTTAVNVVNGGLEGTLHLPYGSSAAISNSSIVVDSGDLGIKCLNGNTPVTFTSVDVFTGPDRWRAEFTTPPTTGSVLEVSVALYLPALGAAGGPTTGARSPINDGSSDASYFGVTFPNHIAPTRFTVTMP